MLSERVGEVLELYREGRQIEAEQKLEQVLGIINNVLVFVYDEAFEACRAMLAEVLEGWRAA